MNTIFRDKIVCLKMKIVHYYIITIIRLDFIKMASFKFLPALFLNYSLMYF